MGTPGSEHLEQSGQMILKLNGLKKVQAPYLELSKAKKIVEPYRVLKENIKVQNPPQEENQLFGVLNYDE
jgi:S-DNA-T family DNA segregation ATPase FtsK/SpoIIIE